MTTSITVVLPINRETTRIVLLAGSPGPGSPEVISMMSPEVISEVISMMSPEVISEVISMMSPEVISMTSPEVISIDKKYSYCWQLNSALYVNQLTFKLRFGIDNLIAGITLSYRIHSKYSYVVCITRSKFCPHWQVNFSRFGSKLDSHDRHWSRSTM